MADALFQSFQLKPLDELYFNLVPLSKNEGKINYDKLIKGEQQNIIKNNNNKFSLYRIGDAVSSRNIHAAIYDALRLLVNI